MKPKGRSGVGEVYLAGYRLVARASRSRATAAAKIRVAVKGAAAASFPQGGENGGKEG